MIEFRKGNIFDTDCEAIVNTTNCMGVMGAGLAKAFIENHPISCKNYNKYSKDMIKKNGIMLLDPWIDDMRYDPWDILMFPTKIDWRNPSKLEYLERGLPLAIELLQDRFISSCAWPLLGTMNGKLAVDDVLPIMIKHLEKFDGRVEIWEHKP